MHLKVIIHHLKSTTLMSISLKNLSTFRTDVSATELVTIQDVQDIHQLITSQTLANYPAHITLGWWSNIVFTKDFEWLVLHNKLLWKEIINEDAESLSVKISSWEDRNTFVERSINQDLSGLENLIMIPWTLGWAPVQNIGAYGVELRDVLVEVEGIDLDSWKTTIYSNEECEFWYRDSIFKHTLKQSFFITYITVRLNKISSAYNPRTHYADIETVLLLQWRDGKQKLHPRDVAAAVSYLRTQKLPDPAEIWTVGSFFQNPIVNTSLFTKLQQQSPEIKWFTHGPWTTKLSAWQLIEMCGLKGYRTTNLGVYDKHALVLVNYGEHTRGEEVIQLIELIQKKVEHRFWIKLIPEVNVL